MVPIFVISLQTAEDRRKNIAKQFEKRNIAFEWFDAVEGKTLTETELNDLVDLEAVKKFPERLSKGAMGCALSHFYVYKKIVERNHPYAIVLEDDVLINDDFVSVVEKLIPHMAVNEIVLMYTQSWQPLELVKQGAVPLTPAYTLYEPVDIHQPVTASAYIITRAACMSMIKIMLPIKRSADRWGGFYNCGGFQSLRCVYPLIINTVDAKSTIDYVNENLLGKALKLIDRFKIFPFYQLLLQRRKFLKKKMLKVSFVSSKSPD